MYFPPGKCLAAEVAQILNSAYEQLSEACLDNPVILIKEAHFQQYQPYVKYLTWTNVTVHETQRVLPFVLPALDFTITRIQLPCRKGIGEMSVTLPQKRKPDGRPGQTLPKRLPRFIPATGASPCAHTHKYCPSRKVLLVPADIYSCSSKSLSRLT